MDNLPVQFILSRKPKQYLKQGPSHCGMYSIKAILSAYGKDVKTHPKEYHTNWIGQHLFSFAIGEGYNEKILEAHGLQAQGDTAKNLSDGEKIALLKTLISKDNPAMIRIGNGYLSCVYNPILGKLVPHWITLWGYDNANDFFTYTIQDCLKNVGIVTCQSGIPQGLTLKYYATGILEINFGISHHGIHLANLIFILQSKAKVGEAASLLKRLKIGNVLRTTRVVSKKRVKLTKAEKIYKAPWETIGTNC